MNIFKSDKKPTPQQAHPHKSVHKEPTKGILRDKEAGKFTAKEASRQAGKENRQAAAKQFRFAAKDDLLTSVVDPRTNRRMRTKTDAKPHAPIKTNLREGSSCMVKVSQNGARLVFWPNGQTYSGEFNSQGEPHGKGLLTLAEGPGKHAGASGAGLATQWEDGKCVSIEGKRTFEQSVRAYVAPAVEPSGSKASSMQSAGALDDDAETKAAAPQKADTGKSPGRTLLQKLRG